jgi:hypothetical protein
MAMAPKKPIETRQYHQDLTVSKVKHRLERKTDRGDFMTYILRHNDERGMSVSEIEASANAIISKSLRMNLWLFLGKSLLRLDMDCRKFYSCWLRDNGDSSVGNYILSSQEPTGAGQTWHRNQWNVPGGEGNYFDRCAEPEVHVSGTR